MQRRVPLTVLAVVALSAGATALLTPSGAATASPSLVFGSPTVVNEFAPGYEPDVIADASSTAQRGALYSSWPNGFSTTISYLDRSNDDGKSFHPTEGSVGGKPFTCVGGGDSELQQDRKDGQLLFNDLQGLTNFSTSSSTDGGKTVSTTCVGVKGVGVDRQWVAIDDNGGTSSIGSGAADGRAYLFYDNVAQNVADGGGNAPVVNVSTDGINYGGCADAAASVCQLPADQISAEDDIVGNAFVDDNPTSPRYHEVYEVRGSSNSTSVLISGCRGAAPGKATTAAATAGACSQTLNADPTSRVDPAWTDHTVAKLPAGSMSKSFIVGDLDSAGNIYVTWVQYPYAADGSTVTGDGKVMLATSKDGGVTFSKPQQLNTAAQHTVIFPWIAAGDPGRVDIAYYEAPQASDGGLRGPDGISNGTWNVAYAASTNALAATPTFTRGLVSDHVVKYGNISTGGLGGAEDRSLGDYLQVKKYLDGSALVSYVDDTSGNRNIDATDNPVTGPSGEDPPEAAGPTMLAKQVGGPSLLAKVGSLNGTAAYGATTDPVGKGYPDAYLSLAGLDTPATPALDVAGASVTRPDPTHLRITLKTDDPALADDLAPAATQGGLYANWYVRWAGRYGTSGNDGKIYYVGMQAGPDGTPSYYTGTTSSIDSTRTKYFAYPTTTTVPGAISKGTITWTVPLSDIGKPVNGSGLYSVTGFTVTQPTPSVATVTTSPTGGGVGNTASPVANLIDAAPSFSYVLGTTAKPPVSTVPPKTSPGKGATPPSGSGHLPTTGLDVVVPLGGLVLLGCAVVLRRRRVQDLRD